MPFSQRFARQGCESVTVQRGKRIMAILRTREEDSRTSRRCRDSSRENNSAATVQVHFLHIRKTGGTAIAEALKPVARFYGIVLHGHSTKLSDIPASSKVVFFVRHPLSRYVSGFYSRLRRGLPRHYYDWTEDEARAFSRFQTANDLAEALTSADREVTLHAREAMQSVRHINSSYREWLGGTAELDNKLDAILLVGLQEKLRSDFEYLKKQLDLPETLSLPESDLLAHRTPAEFDRRLSAVAERNLLEWYAEDIRFYEHCLELRARHGPW